MAAAYSSERSAYSNARAEIVDLKREVAYQHSVIVGQRRQLGMQGGFARTRVAGASISPGSQVSMISYGWGYAYRANFANGTAPVVLRFDADGKIAAYRISLPGD